MFTMRPPCKLLVALSYGERELWPAAADRIRTQMPGAAYAPRKRH
jgi:hypothetical protein